LKSYLPFFNDEHETDSDTNDNPEIMVTDTTPVVNAETELGNDAISPVDPGVIRDFMSTSRNNDENHETRIKELEINVGVINEQKDQLDDRVRGLEEHTKDMDVSIERNRDTTARVIYEQYEEINKDLIKPIQLRLQNIEKDLSVTQQNIAGIELQLLDEKVSHTKRVHDDSIKTISSPPNKRAKDLDARIDDLERRMQNAESRLNNLDEWCINTDNSIADITHKQTAMEQWAVDLHRDRKSSGIFEFLLCKKVHNTVHGTPCQKPLHHDGDCSSTSYGKDPDPRPSSEKFPRVNIK